MATSIRTHRSSPSTRSSTKWNSKFARKSSGPKPWDLNLRILTRICIRSTSRPISSASCLRSPTNTNSLFAWPATSIYSERDCRLWVRAIPFRMQFSLQGTMFRSPDGTTNYVNLIKNLQPGVTEVFVHLAHDDVESQAIMVGHPEWGAAWRQREFDAVSSAEFRKALEENHVVLIGWRNIQKLIGGPV